MVDISVQAGIQEPLRISDFQVKTIVRGWLLVTETQDKWAKNGRLFRQMRLRDQRGNTITANQFDLPRGDILAPQAGRVALVEGMVEEFHNEMVLKLNHAQLDESASPELFLLGTRRPIEQIEEHFRELMSKVYHEGLHALLHRCFSTEVMEKFRRWPAALRQHGAVRGGLIEHTVHVTLIADRLAQLYVSDSNLVLAGALLHDIGKLEELEEEAGMGYTARGRMFGHIILGANHVAEQARHIPSLDEATLTDLLHIILAHHGTKEHGSPVCPTTIEALVVHLADTTEARLTGFLDHCDRTSGSEGWTSYSKDFGSQLRLP